MLTPPFRLARPLLASRAEMPSPLEGAAGCCAAVAGAATAPAGRSRLSQLDPQLHCSVIGTCLGAAELRKTVSRFIEPRSWSDLELHHEAVGLAHRGGAAAKALHKALDARHDATIRQFAGARDAVALERLWDEARRQGEIPGAYWALLTHREATPALRHKAFGEVHMLSHLVGAANRADIRRLVALEGENAELRERLERLQERLQESIGERDMVVAGLQRERLEAERRCAHAESLLEPPSGAGAGAPGHAVESERVAAQAARRERAEHAAAVASAEVDRLAERLRHAERHADTLGQELAAAEAQLRDLGDGEAGPGVSALGPALRGRRILYVGGRPSSTPAIRALVQRHGGEFRRHDGGIEDRKGLLAAAVAGADLVLFPVDCVDHDSVGNLKRLCLRQGIAFVALRSASVASFAAGVAATAPPRGGGSRPDRPDPPFCLRHG